MAGHPHDPPIHWGTFNLAMHPWAEPGEGTVAAARAEGARVALPRPGEPFEPTAETVPSEPWWRAVAAVPAGGWPAAEDVRTDAPTKGAAGGPTDTAGDVPGGTAEDTGDPAAIPAG